MSRDATKGDFSTGKKFRGTDISSADLSKMHTLPRMTMTKSSTSEETSSASTRQREWISLVLPWAAVVLSAVIAAALYNDNNENAEEEDFFTRQLYGDDGYVPPTVDFPNSSSSSSLHPEHHHKPVYSEDHPPLFPLTGRDYAGFILAVMGLMVAVRLVRDCLYVYRLEKAFRILTGL